MVYNGFKDDPTVCGFQQYTDCRLVDWKEGYAEVSMRVAPHHLNRNGGVHGGALITLLDITCGYAANFSTSPENRRAVTTVALNTNFIIAVGEGKLRAIGKLRGGGEKTVAVTAEVIDDQNRVVALAQGSYRYLAKQ